MMEVIENYGGTVTYGEGTDVLVFDKVPVTYEWTDEGVLNKFRSLVISGPMLLRIMRFRSLWKVDRCYYEL